MRSRPKTSLEKFCDDRKQSGIISNACQHYFGKQTQETLIDIDKLAAQQKADRSALKAVLESYRKDMTAIQKSLEAPHSEESIESVVTKK